MKAPDPAQPGAPSGASVVFRSDPRVARGLPHSSSRRMRISALFPRSAVSPTPRRSPASSTSCRPSTTSSLRDLRTKQPVRATFSTCACRPGSPAAPALAGQLLGGRRAPRRRQGSGTAPEFSRRFTSGRRFGMPTGRAARGRDRRPGPAPRSPRPSDPCQPKGRSANRA